MSGLPIDIIDGGAGSFYGLSGGNNAFVRPNWAPGATTSTATSNIPAGYFFNPLAFVRPTVLTGQVIPSSNGTFTSVAMFCAGQRRPMLIFRSSSVSHFESRRTLSCAPNSLIISTSNNPRLIQFAIKLNF